MSTQYPGSKKKPRTLDLEALSRELATLPVAPPAPRAPRTDTMRYVVERLREPLIEAVRRQHTIRALAEFLGRQGVKIHPATLRRYLRPVRSGASDG